MTPTPQTPRIGIIGIGAMGLAMARNLHARSYPVRVRDIDPQALARAAALGLEAAASAAELAAKADVLIVVVVDAQQIETVLFGADGVIHGARLADPCDPRSARSTPLTVLLCSTIAAHDTERFHTRLAAHAIDLLDAPISGGPVRAADGSMSMMLAGADALRVRHARLLGDLAAKLFYVGPKVGDAARTKLVNNLLAGVNLVAAAEALALGAQLGLDRHALSEVINASSGASWIGHDRMARALVEDFVPRARAVILTKDVTLAVAMADAAGIDTPLADVALGVFNATVAAGFGEQDDAAVIKTLWPGF